MTIDQIIERTKENYNDMKKKGEERNERFRQKEVENVEVKLSKKVVEFKKCKCLKGK